MRRLGVIGILQWWDTGMKILRSFAIIMAMGCASLSAAKTASAGAVVVQNTTGDLSSVSLNGTATLTPIGSASLEYNNMGWSSVDGNLYALELFGSGTNPGNRGLLRINPADGTVQNLGNPMGLPVGTSSRFDAGDINGNTMWISLGAAGANTLYTLDLSAVTGGGNDISGTAVTSRAITGTNVQVNDWAYNPTDQLLYGADRLTSALVTLDPATGVRSTFAVAGLVSNLVAFGAAWYDPTIGDVFLYNNGGTVFQVDPGTMTLVNSWSAPAVSRNDATFVPMMVIAEPGTLALFGLGLVGLGLARRRSFV